MKKTNSKKFRNQTKGDQEMIHQKCFSNIFIIPVIIIAGLLSTAINGCSDSNLAGVNSNESRIQGSGEKRAVYDPDSTLINLDLTIKYKSEIINDSKVLESNIGNSFNHIISIDTDIKPNEEFDLQELQPYGIFGLYLSSTGSFSLTNSDGLNFTSKTILLERCAFIDLKLRNEEQTTIHVRGFIAGE